LRSTQYIAEELGAFITIIVGPYLMLCSLLTILSLKWRIFWDNVFGSSMDDPSCTLFSIEIPPNIELIWSMGYGLFHIDKEK
jgi:hypothetical protein